MADNNDKLDTTGLEHLINLKTVDILRDYFLGYKKNGRPRAVYDIVKDQLKLNRGKGGKKGKHRQPDKFSLYVEPNRKKGKKKGKKGKKSKKHWEY